MNRDDAIYSLLLEAEVRNTDGQPGVGLVIRAANLCEDAKFQEYFKGEMAQAAKKAGIAVADCKVPKELIPTIESYYDSKHVGEIIERVVDALWAYLDGRKGKSVGFGK